MKTAVIFRRFVTDGSLIALFPLEPSGQYGHHCLSYQHVGQHGGATPYLMNRKFTAPVTLEQAGELVLELQQIGYELKIMQRFPCNAFAIRKAKAK